LAATFGGHPRVFLWDLAGDNPYRAILASADRLVVTSDSVSMVSEAIASPHPVEVFDLGFTRHQSFIQGLVDRRLIRRFDGDPSAPVTLGPMNATTEAARRVRALLQGRTGVSG
jgi:mitochondrial fission protein ELM1